MNWLRDILRRWLGVPGPGQIPTPEQIRRFVLREIDADAAWRTGLPDWQHPHHVQRANLKREREAAILLGQREDTRV